MPIEVITTTSGFTALNETYPLEGDNVSDGDNHLRLIKSVLKNNLGNGSMEFKVLTLTNGADDWMIITSQQPGANLREGTTGTLTKDSGGYAIVMLSEGTMLCIGVLVSSYIFTNVAPTVLINSSSTNDFKKFILESDGEMKAADWYVEL